MHIHTCLCVSIHIQIEISISVSISISLGIVVCIVATRDRVPHARAQSIVATRDRVSHTRAQTRKRVPTSAAVSLSRVRQLVAMELGVTDAAVFDTNTAVPAGGSASVRDRMEAYQAATANATNATARKGNSPPPPPLASSPAASSQGGASSSSGAGAPLGGAGDGAKTKLMSGAPPDAAEKQNQATPDSAKADSIRPPKPPGVPALGLDALRRDGGGRGEGGGWRWWSRRGYGQYDVAPRRARGGGRPFSGDSVRPRSARWRRRRRRRRRRQAVLSPYQSAVCSMYRVGHYGYVTMDVR